MAGCLCQPANHENQIMLKLKNVTLRLGPKVLFANADLVVYKGQRVGVTGANGAGKSSLFALLLNRLDSDEGTSEIANGLVFASTDQEIESTDRIALDYVIDGDRQLRRIEGELNRVQQINDGELYASLLTEYEQAGAYTAESRASSLLNGLGFSAQQQNQPFSEFSGGWRMRLNLARALMCQSDILLLDEPTNHLDLDAVLWLESWLLHYRGTLMLISHDREFLDRVCTHIAHIEQKRIKLYTGNYSAFEQQRAERLAVQQAGYARQQKEIAHIRNFVRRFKAKATKARQAQSRIKALQRMELISAAHIDSTFRFRFPDPEHLPSPLIVSEDLDCGHHHQRVVENINMRIQSGQKIGLLGMNGAGKSTFVRTLAGELHRLGGEIRSSVHLRFGYFAQHQLEQLPADGHALSYLQSLDPDAAEPELRNFAGGFGFHGDQVFDPVATMSGGEKARLVLAGIVYLKPNFLILDEPTNHLDLDMRHALTLALQDFPGALMLVSHDRHLLRCCTDELWLIANGRLQEFESDLDGYTKWLDEQRRTKAMQTKPTATDASRRNTASVRKDRKRQQAEARKRILPLKAEADKMERLLDASGERLLILEHSLADPQIYDDTQKSRLQALLKEQADEKQRYAQYENDWLETLEKLENFSRSKH